MEAHDVGATKGTEWVAGFPRREAGPEEGGAEVRARGRTTEVVSRTGNPVACSSSRAPNSRAERKAAPVPDGPAASPARPPSSGRTFKVTCSTHGCGRTTFSRTGNPVVCNTCRMRKYHAKRKRARAPDKLAADPARARKRVRDVASSGNNLDMERNVVRDFVDAWTGTFGENTAKVMNDSTKSDAIVRLTAKKDAWLKVQVKTTSGAMTRGRRKQWRFSQVTGYTGMLVVCWRCDKGDAWVFDGAVLDERGIRDLKVTPGGENCKLALERDLNLAADDDADLVRYIAALAEEDDADLWPTVTEYDARKEFKSAEHELEHLGILAYQDSFQGDYDYPKRQGSHVDLLKFEPRDGKEVTTRLQFKTARKAYSGFPGFMCDLRTSAGRYEGKQHYQPYADDAFDELVVVAWVKNTAGEKKAAFWVIPAKELKKQGYLRSESGDVDGMMCLRLHSQDIGVQPKQNTGRPANTWTSEFYVGIQE